MSEKRPGLSSNYSRQFQSGSVARNINLTDDEVDNIIQGFANEDEYSMRTWSRRIVEGFLAKQKWYFPRAGDANAPSLSKAYAYYEHITLPRKFVGDNVADHKQSRAEPGESAQETELYNPFTTPASAFIEWGIGVDLYFSSLRALAFILLVAGIINIPSILYYASSDYSANLQDSLDSITLKGSAICTTFEWVVCNDCVESSYTDDVERGRFAVAEDGTILVQRNQCDGATTEHALVSWATLLFITVSMGFLSLYWGAREVRFDEDKITPTDYSLVVQNPPDDAFDPDEWRDFFDAFKEKQVTCVTVAINNDVMLRKLIARRSARETLELMLPKGANLDKKEDADAAAELLLLEQAAEPEGTIGWILHKVFMPIVNPLGLLLPADKLVAKVFRLTDEIKELQKKEYKVVKVYVTFETEEGQRNALYGLSVGKLDALVNNTASLHTQGHAFRGTVLDVAEPPEPDAVRYFDLGAGTIRRVFFRTLNICLTLGIVVLALLAVDRTRQAYGAILSGPLVSVLNSVVPQILKILMKFERHDSEGHFQTSLYLKITLFRWINTAVLIKLITPILGTLTETNQSILPSVNSILWSELWITPLLRLGDMFTNLKKHGLAPRARNQEHMNSWFQGTYYNLGERYTDLTKILFLVFVYSALFPAAFFFGAAILFIQYYTDKYCLMRVWGWIPTIGSELPKFSRRYFFSGSVLAMAILSAYAWAQFPYDNLCTPVEPTGINYAATYLNVNLTLVEGEPLQTITVTQATEMLFCPQSWREVSGLSFPPTKRIQPDDRKYMSDSQETLTGIYGWTALAYLVLFLLGLFGGASVDYFMSWIKGNYKSSGEVQNVDFSSLGESSAYVPQVKLIGKPFPYLACDIDQLDQNLVGWNDPARSYDFYNLIFDVPFSGMKRKKRLTANTRGTRQIEDNSGYRVNSSYHPGDGDITADDPEEEGVEVTSPMDTPIFSLVKHYPPKWQQEIFDNEAAGVGERTDM